MGIAPSECPAMMANWRSMFRVIARVNLNRSSYLRINIILTALMTRGDFECHAIAITLVIAAARLGYKRVKVCKFGRCGYFFFSELNTMRIMTEQVGAHQLATR